VMFSTLTSRGASATLDALALGASDYVTKPANVGSVMEGMQQIREVLLPKLKALCPDPTVRGQRTSTPLNPRPTSATRAVLASRPRRIDLVAIGVSTGGPNALAELLRKLPADFPVPIVVVQHMPPVFTRHLASRLDEQCALR